MLFPRPAAATTTSLPVGAFDDPAGATPEADGTAAAGAFGGPGIALSGAFARAGEDDPEAGTDPLEEMADVPPRLLT